LLLLINRAANEGSALRLAEEAAVAATPENTEHAGRRAAASRCRRRGDMSLLFLGFSLNSVFFLQLMLVLYRDSFKIDARGSFVRYGRQ